MDRDRGALLPRIRAEGADVILRNGKAVVRRVSMVPAGLIEEAKARRADLLAEIEVEAAHAAAERAAIIAEAEHGDPQAEVLHTMPPSWADPLIEPTPGAVCRNCRCRAWWCEATDPRGWRCATCHPGLHLPADRRREIST